MKRVRYLDRVVDHGNRSAASMRYALCRSYISTSNKKLMTIHKYFSYKYQNVSVKSDSLRRAVHFQESILARIYFVGSGLHAFAIDSSCIQECVIVKTCHIMTLHDKFMGTLTARHSQ